MYKKLAKLYYQLMWAEHSGEQISATANSNKYTNVT